MRRSIIISCVLLVLAAVVAVTRAGDAPAAAGDPSGITVQGFGTVRVAPDRAQLSFSVESEAATAAAVLAANGAEMRRVLAALRTAGAENLRTQSVSLSPRYDQSGAVDGYRAANVVSATIADLASTGGVIDAAVAAGANRIYGPSLTRANRGDLYRQALRAAVADARTRAQSLSTAANVSLGRIVQIVEGGSARPVTATIASTTAQPASTPIEPGEQEIAAAVTITFSTS